MRRGLEQAGRVTKDRLAVLILLARIQDAESRPDATNAVQKELNAELLSRERQPSIARAGALFLDGRKRSLGTASQHKPERALGVRLPAT